MLVVTLSIVAADTTPTVAMICAVVRRRDCTGPIAGSDSGILSVQRSMPEWFNSPVGMQLNNGAQRQWQAAVFALDGVQ